ncbi:MAG: SDR family oxidoreductase [Woeseiaceae bacterium]
MRNWSGKVAVVTGAASGIGRALAVLLAERGAIVALVDIDEEGLSNTGDQITAGGGVCSRHVVDVADQGAVEALATEVVRQHGAVHLLVNNAGVSVVQRAEAITYDDFEWLMKINFWGVVYGTKSFLPHLRLSDEAHIVNVSSLFGIMSMPLQSAYNASKFAVRGFTEALKMELADSTVGVSCVHPGGIKTEITRNSRIGEGALEMSHEELHSAFERAAPTKPAKAAAVILRGIEKNKRRILIGLDARIADWIVRHFPGTYERILGLEKEVVRGVRWRGRKRS